MSRTPDAGAGALTETRGIGARAIAMGGAFTGVADDVAALYYNPAGLAQMRGHHAHFEYLLVKPDVHVKCSSPEGRLSLNKWTKAPMGGIVVDLSRAIKLSRGIVVGWTGYFPDNFKSVYKVRHGEYYDPFFPRYGDSSSDQAIMLIADAAVEVFPWLLVGGGFNLQIHGQYVNLEVAVNTLGQPVNELSRADMDVTTEVFPLAGVLFKPTNRLRAGFAWRKGVEFLVSGGMNVTTKLVLGPGQVVPVPLNIPTQGHYRPEQVAFGASYQLTSSLLLAADLTWQHWEKYSGEANRPLDPPMENTLVPRIGLEYYVLQSVALRAGYGYQESPLPTQSPGSPVNLLDNNIHQVSLGAGVYWDTFGLFPKPPQWSLFYQLDLLAPRTFKNVHPGQPDLQSSGAFHAFGFGIHFFL